MRAALLFALLSSSCVLAVLQDCLDWDSNNLLVCTHQQDREVLNEIFVAFNGQQWTSGAENPSAGWGLIAAESTGSGGATFWTADPCFDQNWLGVFCQNYVGSGTYFKYGGGSNQAYRVVALTLSVKDV